MTFVDVSSSSGFSPAMNADIPAGGIAVADFDNNGWPDIFVTGYSLPNRLFFNLGNGSFSENATINQQLAGVLCSVAAAADFDNDGRIDLYVGCRGDANHLFRNLGGAGFADVTPPALQHDPANLQGQRTDAVAWGDIDGNGLPDLFIGIYPDQSQPDLSDPDNLDRLVLNLGQGEWLDVGAGLPADPRGRAALAAAVKRIAPDREITETSSLAETEEALESRSAELVCLDLHME
ncbi:MAG: FG-GAP repeat domain-containing protein, partial [Wenzhouxiangellaceae bacterium]